MRNTINQKYNIDQKHSQWEIQPMRNITLMKIQPMRNTTNEKYNIDDKYNQWEIQPMRNITLMINTTTEKYNKWEIWH